MIGKRVGDVANGPELPFLQIQDFILGPNSPILSATKKREPIV